VALVLTALVVTAVPAQEPLRQYTNPRLPNREALDRLSLSLAWSVRVPTDGRRDGLFSVQLLPGPGGRDQVLVQTVRGRLILIDGETGDVVWNTLVPPGYQVEHAPGFTREDILVLRRNVLHVVSRKSGKERLYTVDAKDKHVVMGLTLSYAPSAPAVAEDPLLFLALGSRLSSYYIPRFAAAEKAAADEAAGIKPEPKKKPPKKSLQDKDKEEPPPGSYQSEPAFVEMPNADLKASSLQVEWLWSKLTDEVPVLYPPVITEDTVCLLGSEGTLLSLGKNTGKERGLYKLGSDVAAPWGQHGRNVYIGTIDHRVWAFNAEQLTVRWRYMAAAPVVLQPWVTDANVYVSAGRKGMACLDRLSGDEVWKNRQAERFLAAGPKLVYARDPGGKLMVLDGARGTTLGVYDLSDYTVPYSNELTDRILLGAHDGTVICLHHRDSKTPFKVRVPPKTETKTPGGKKGDPKKTPGNKTETPAKEKKEMEKEKGARLSVPQPATEHTPALTAGPGECRQPPARDVSLEARG
jgi:hypothetical protein